MYNQGEQRLACADILKTLRYFGLFQYPMTLEEIEKFASCSFSKELLDQSIALLCLQEKVFQKEIYFLSENQPTWIQARKAGENLARKKMSKAHLSARIISCFPFVRSVCISGSLSKGIAQPHSDIDFFIITAEDRLWICRTLLHVFKKLCFLFGSQHAFCMNYFLDESHLILEEKNRFTATELMTLIPLYGHPTYQNLILRNQCWIQLHLPNQSLKDRTPYPEPHPGFAKTWVEKFFSICYPHQLNQYLLQITDRKWRKKWRRRQFPMAEYDLAMKTKWYVSKQHPLNYQKKVMEKWSQPPSLMRGQYSSIP